MKIAIFSDSFRKSKDGVATVTSVLAEEMTKRGHSITVVCPNDNTEVLKDKGYKVICVKSHSVNLYREHMVCFKTPEYLEKLDDFSAYDLIHLQTNITMGALGFLIALKYNKPVSCTFHTNIADFAGSFFDKEILTKEKNPIYKILGHSRLVLRGGKIFTTNTVWNLTKNFHNAVPTTTVPSRYCRHQLRSKGVKNPIIVLNNPVNSGESKKDYSKKYNLKDKFVILHVGRLSVEKRINTLVEVVSRLKNTCPKISAVICSDGPARNSLVSLAKKLGVSDRIKFTGFIPRDELNWLYERCSVVTAFGLFETFNLCATEALYYKKPLVISDAGPHSEIINGNGFLVPVNEKEEEVFAEKIKLLYNNKRLYSSFCRKSGSLSKYYNYKATIDKHEAYFINSASQNEISNLNYLNFIKYISNLSIAINVLLFSLSLKFKGFDALSLKIEDFLKKIADFARGLKKSF